MRTGMWDIQEMQFNKVTFWVQIHRVLLLCMTFEIDRFLGSMIGEVKEVDDRGSGDCIRKYIRVMVVVDVSKPFRRGEHRPGVRAGGVSQDNDYHDNRNGRELQRSNNNGKFPTVAEGSGTPIRIVRDVDMLEMSHDSRE
ncbi:hypothetical protein Dsin_002713 [Dipteronia sinensis]|uniref:DUF4283 domain-containing protein n=1 Tax=Dipteronia sinensis TaxID=43782 RepID=A0AAE0B7M3_9ROSI|nr:hypothetical protein Dsin_002713 [Dipteronia sinensis]